MHIFIVCYNEAIMIPHTVSHYRSRFPECTITILDNYSSDASVEIAKNLGCSIKPLDTGGIINDYILSEVKSNGWKGCDSWVIICDMDEWLCVNESNLRDEEEKGVTILRVKGYNIIADSQSVILDDVNLHSLTQGIFNPYECKNICFNAKYITDMHFSLGSHSCSPVGKVVFSDKEYILKHMDELGFPYKCFKNKIRYDRSEKMRTQYGMCSHYVKDESILSTNLQRLLQECRDISHLLQ
jgi:hypothetical protein